MTGGLNLSANLPLEVTLEILSRVPIKSIIMCKLVCKSWRDLVESQYFAKSHFCIRRPHLFVSRHTYGNNSKSYKIFEFVCENGALDAMVNFCLPINKHVHSSANGLVLLCGRNFLGSISVCNPITREYVRLPNPPRCWTRGNVGFGVSRRSGTYKIVHISQDHDNECLVYTLGTGQWRRVAGGAPPTLGYNTVCTFVSGNLYWLVCDPESRKPQISCFDLETEVFSSFPAPPCLDAPESYYNSLSALGDRLCFFDDSTFLKRAVIWLMREDGCWTKESVVKTPYIGCGYFFPIKLFQNGDMLMGDMGIGEVFYYSKKTNSVRTYQYEFTSKIGVVLYTPNFLPLKTLAMDIKEDV